jgi:hypothetical protein
VQVFVTNRLVLSSLRPTLRTSSSPTGLIAVVLHALRISCKSLRATPKIVLSDTIYLQ